MPIGVITSPCKTCSTGQPLPDGAAFCPNCGRTAVGAAAVPPANAGSWLAIGVVVAVVTVLVGVGLVGLLLVVRVTHTTRPAVAVVHARPTPAAVVVPTVPTAPTETEPPEPPATTDAVPAAPLRPGDTDLTVDPLAAYAGGPTADHLSLRGLRLGLSLADVPPAMLADAAPDHLRDLGGNLYAVDGGRISEVHVRDPDLLARWPIDSINALAGHFGPAGDVYPGDGNDAVPTYLYPDRGIHVRWDVAAGRIVEVVLVRPAGR